MYEAIPLPLWLHYRQPIRKSVSPTYKVCHLNGMLGCNHCNLHQLLSHSDCWCSQFWSTFALPLCMSFYSEGPTESHKNLYRHRQDVSGCVRNEMVYIDIHLKLLVSPLRILQPCSCVPTSWTRKTFLASRTPSWFSIGVMRTEREWAGGLKGSPMSLSLYLPTGDTSSMQKCHGLLGGMYCK